ncbi:o-succinylbenzoate--CoA ligase [Corynebacterium sp. zg-331]|uniref:o-succinylbenzoate--CoA ligase n=1 Tax=unclassified Corynebacterium TaxID=2624378 RepID=UPI00128D0C52|nr:MULTISPECIES: o-succinylbenzoate--CoA ligase [unclassified Corynebacterium]MBC3186087.1 o-succinylbenzoate--CoA ligase [Corynebacterium sp. zg-331]MPV52577.1 o-succinylbenzoate--CoA ligase [Corynebacterium sp. zg331]
MAERILEPLVVPSTDASAILPDLREALAGRRSLLPLPDNDPGRAQLLRTTQRVGQAIDREVALVVSTSGSTGTPKGAELSARNLLSSAAATHEALGGDGTWLLAMPGHYIAGLQVLVRSLAAGTTPVCLDLCSGFRVPAFAQAARRLAGPRTYTALTPAQLLKAMDRLEGIEALRTFSAVLIGGAPLRQADARAAAELGIRVVRTYGASETSGGCVYDGRPLPGVRLRLDEQDRIHLGGPMIARGYRNTPGHEAFAREGWFATSDAGTLADDGTLTVRGRIDAIIDSGGLKLHPEVLEYHLREVPGVTEACVVGVPHPRLGQAIAVAYTGQAQPEDLIEALDALPRWQLPKELRRVDALPRTGSGKVHRAGVAALLAKG